MNKVEAKLELPQRVETGNRERLSGVVVLVLEETVEGIL